MSLAPGDRITVGVTHQILIHGDNAWVKVEVNSAVQEGEDTEAAWSRVNTEVSEHIVKVIEDQVATVLAYEESKKEPSAEPKIRIR